MTKNIILSTGHAGLVLGAALLAIGAGCSRETTVQATVAASPPAPVVAAAQNEPPSAVVVEQDDYVYYPNYEIYYSSNRHQYRYRDGNAWVTRSAPPGVSINVLFASPSVRMDFHDTPERHHDSVVRSYPRNWAPPAKGPANRDNHSDDRKDDRKDDGKSDDKRHN